MKWNYKIRNPLRSGLTCALRFLAFLPRSSYSVSWQSAFCLSVEELLFRGYVFSKIFCTTQICVCMRDFTILPAFCYNFLEVLGCGFFFERSGGVIFLKNTPVYNTRSFTNNIWCRWYRYFPTKTNPHNLYSWMCILINRASKWFTLTQDSAILHATYGPGLLKTSTRVCSSCCKAAIKPFVAAPSTWCTSKKTRAFLCMLKPAERPNGAV